MRTKLCEKCNQVEIEMTSGNKKYCEGCRTLANRESVKKHAEKKGSGIYMIQNLVNGKIYIGQSVQLNKRIQSHKRTLKNNKHYNSHLQRSYNKYGFENFKFIIVENCDIEELNKRELYWMNHYNSHDKNCGYNSDSPSETEGKYIMSKEAKEKLSKTRTKYTKEDLISYLQEYYYHYGKIPTVMDIRHSKGFPSDNVYTKKFGNFKEALIEAGLYELIDNTARFNRRIHTKESVYLVFKEFIDKNNRFPNGQELKNYKENGLVFAKQILKYYGSTENLMLEFGFSREQEKEEENKIALLNLKKLYDDKHYITSRDINECEYTRCVVFYANRFGSLVEAYKLAQIPVEEGLISGTIRVKKK